MDNWGEGELWGGEGVGGWEKRVLFGGEGGNRDDKPLFLPRDCPFFPQPAEPQLAGRPS